MWLPAVICSGRIRQQISSHGPPACCLQKHRLYWVPPFKNQVTLDSTALATFDSMQEANRSLPT